jgi:head-tail adaptor
MATGKRVRFNCGRLRHRIVWKSRTAGPPGPTSAGQPSISYQVADELSGSIEYLKGDEAIRADQVRSIATVKITFRAGPAIRPTDRLEHRGRRYEVMTALEDLETNAYLILTCAEIAP